MCFNKSYRNECVVYVWVTCIGGWDGTPPFKQYVLAGFSLCRILECHCLKYILNPALCISSPPLLNHEEISYGKAPLKSSWYSFCLFSVMAASKNLFLDRWNIASALLNVAFVLYPWQNDGAPCWEAFLPGLWATLQGTCFGSLLAVSLCHLFFLSISIICQLISRPTKSCLP